MDFSWTQEQDQLYNNLLHLVREKIQLSLPGRDQFWTRDQWRDCGDLGLLGLSVPVRYGGKGYDALTTARAIEAFGKSCEDMGLVFSVAAHLFACAMPIIEGGSQMLKESLLAGLCSGAHVGANAITEPEAGSDIFALRTRAIRDDDFYVLDGCKSYVSNGPVADLFVVYAVTNPAHGYLGISSFVIPRETPGLLIGEPLHKMGLTSTPACRLVFEQCRVPVTYRLGREGQGASIFKRSMHWERSCLFASYIGLMERQLERTVRYAKERQQFGKALIKHQAIAHRLADMQLRLEAARLLLYRACWLLDQGQEVGAAISMAKLAISEAAVQGGLDAIHIHGSLGLDCDYGIESMLRDALPATLFSGTSEMQYEIIAGEMGIT